MFAVSAPQCCASPPPLPLPPAPARAADLGLENDQHDDRDDHLARRLGVIMRDCACCVYQNKDDEREPLDIVDGHIGRRGRHRTAACV